MLIRRLARPLLGSVFVVAGSETTRHPGASAPAAEPLVNKALAALPSQLAQYLPRNPEIYVRLTGATQLVAGLALASGKFPRISSLVLASTVVPTTLTSHAFWQEADPALKAQQKVHFWKNVSILGGLIIAGVDTEGRPDLSWRARRAARNAVAAVASAIPVGAPSSPALTDRVHEFADTTQAFAESASERLADVSAALGAKTAELGKTARKKAPIIAEYAQHRGAELAEIASQRGSELADRATQQAVELGKTARQKVPVIAEYARERGAEVAEIAQHRGAELAEIASQRGSELADRAAKQAAELAKATLKGRGQVEALAAEQRPKLDKLIRRFGR